MCKTWAFVHTCGHTFTFRLSTCRGTYTHTTRKSRIPASLCRGTPSWGFKSRLKCGACCKADEEQRLEADIAQLRVELADADDFLIDAEHGYSSLLWKLHEKYPDGRFKKTARPANGPPPTRRSSILRNEVQIEDLPEDPQPKPSFFSSANWDEQWNWAASLASLDDEIAENEKEREDAGLPPLSSDAWEAPGWNSDADASNGDSDRDSTAEEPQTPSPPSEPSSLPHIREPLYLSQEYAMLDCDPADPEEDLFTFPEERFLAVTAPVEDVALHAVSYITTENSKPSRRAAGLHDRRSGKTSGVDALADQGMKSLHGGRRAWPRELSVTS